MKTKILNLFLLLVTGIGSMFASDTQVDGIWYYFDSSTKIASVTFRGSKHSDYENEYQGNIVIPSSVVYKGATYRVTSIADLAFAGCPSLRSITIPSSVTHIGSYAFTDCFGLSSVQIPNTVTYVGSYAFRGCSVDSMNYLGTLHNWINKSWSQDWNDYNTRYQLFLNGILLEDVSIPENITNIPNRAFMGCTSLKSVSLHNNVISVGDHAFYFCDNLTSLTIGNSVTDMSEYAFNTEFSKISSIYFEGNINDWLNKSWGYISLDYKLFFYGELQEDIIIPNYVTNIAYNAFWGCGSLRTLTIPNSVTNAIIEYGRCPNLESIVVASDNPNYSSIGGVLYDKEGTTLLRCPVGKQGTYTIPSNVTSIAYGAFSGCDNLISVTIPENISSVANNAFNGVLNIIYAGSLSVSSWGARSVNGYMENNIVYSDETKTNLLACSKAIKGEIEIPNSVTSIGERAFRDCAGLTSVTIPNSVTSIGSSTFYGCAGLTSITIPNSVTSIGQSAFYGCENLKSISIPNSVTSISTSAFYGCSGLTYVTIPNSVTSIGQSAFYGCENLKSISIPNSVTSIGSDAFSNCISLTSVSIPNNITRIEDDTFYKCSSLASVIIPKDVTYIGNDAFYGCRNLTSIVWDAKNCSAYKFGGQLESVVFGNEVENIPNSLCAGKTNITSIVVPNNVISIGENAFIRCSNLQTLTLGENITTYGSSAFSECSSLTSIYNYRRTPVALNANVFKDVDYFACTLYVLEGSVDMYKSDRSSWKDFFYNIEPISATQTTTGNDIQVTPADNTANIVWQQVNGAETYELVIKDKSGNIICTLIFNAQGQLTSIAFSAPSRNNVPQQTQTAGFAFTVTGLNSGTNYDLEMTSKNSNGGTIQTKTVSFTTTGNTQSVENILGGNAQSTKIFRNGQIYILRGEKTYTLQGQEVK